MVVKVILNDGTERVYNSVRMISDRDEDDRYILYICDRVRIFDYVDVFSIQILL